LYFSSRRHEKQRERRREDDEEEEVELTFTPVVKPTVTGKSLSQVDYSH